MPGFNTEVPHSLGQEAARKRMDTFISKIEARDDISDMAGEWTENILNYSFTTFGIKIKGKLAVEDDKVRMDGDLPFAAMMFKGKISGQIQKALEKALA